jgi:L-lysine epsilon oxidase-like protein
VELTSRRAFLQRSSAAAALVALPSVVAAGCSGGGEYDRIVRVAIHPALGVGRVGNSPDAMYFGPDVPGALPRAPRGFKDADGAVARQAARFRIYGLDASGSPVRELTAHDADITWRLTVANAKPAWYAFNTAFDIPEAMTDGAGRLVVLPGRGAAYRHGQASLSSYAGNDGWADDVSDGLVRATVRLGRRRLEADPAWVIATPPNYAPAMPTGLVTLYDVVRSMFVQSGTLDAPPVSLGDDILPLFARLSDMQWVSKGYFDSEGFGSGHDWLAPATVERLADPSPRAAAYRRSVFAQFRDPSFTEPQPDAIPDLYGDHVAIPARSNRQWLAVTDLQYTQLGAWAEGRFHDDRERIVRRSSRLEDLPVAEQPHALDRAALESVLGGAFHPGLEAPWILRRRSTWARPWRLRVASADVDERDWGSELTQGRALAPDGPVQGLSPGAITRWLGVPWHGDAASCRSGYQASISTVLPAFWVARVPVQVLSEDDYQVVMDRTRPRAEREAAFQRRRGWERFIARKTRPPTLRLMVEDWPRMGMVTQRPGPGDAGFPSTFKVESYVGFEHEPTHDYGADQWFPGA